MRNALPPRQEPVLELAAIKKQRRRHHLLFEAKLLQRVLTAEEQAELSAMIELQKKAQARVTGFCKKLPEARAPPVFSKLKLPRAASTHDVPMEMWNRSADRRFTRKFSMRGRARWNPRANLCCEQGVEGKLEDVNYGRCTDFPAEAWLEHST